MMQNYLHRDGMGIGCSLAFGPSLTELSLGTEGRHLGNELWGLVPADM